MRGGDVHDRSGQSVKSSLGIAVLAPLTSAVLVAVLAFWTAGPLVAQQDPPAEWEPTRLVGPVSELFTPASGAFFARTPAGVVRSDDAGATWTPLSVPAGLSVWTVHPGDHTVLYATSPEGLFRSGDDGATWTMIRSGVPKALTLSAAERDLIYVADQDGNYPH